MGHNFVGMESKCAAFGANACIVEGNNIGDIVEKLERAKKMIGKPIVFICKTFKGKDFGDEIEDKENWHGKPLEKEAEKTIAKITKSMKNP